MMSILVFQVKDITAQSISKFLSQKGERGHLNDTTRVFFVTGK